MAGRDWSVFTRQHIFNHFYQLGPKLVGKDLTPKQIHGYFQRQARKLAPIIVTRVSSMDVDNGYVYIGGCYEAELDMMEQPSISISLHFHPWDDVITYTQKRLKRGCILLADTLLHEIIHMRQHRRRDFVSKRDYQSNATPEKKKHEQSYMGNHDEIDAYSFNIACELYRHFGNDHNAIHRYLNTTNANAKKSPIWKWYMKTFDYDHNNPVIQKVKTKVVKYLPLAALGKPFKNNDWLTY